MALPMKTAKKKVAKVKIRPGTYTSEITNVADHKDYRVGDACLITYQLSSGDDTFVYRETFINDPDDPRYAEFMDYLSKNGIEATDWDQLLGLREEVQLLKESKGKRGVYLNIVERRVL